jgi:hypothetical protein
LAAAISALATTPAFADHNSPMGAGWVNISGLARFAVAAVLAVSTSQAVSKKIMAR